MQFMHPLAFSCFRRLEFYDNKNAFENKLYLMRLWGLLPQADIYGMIVSNCQSVQNNPVSIGLMVVMSIMLLWLCGALSCFVVLRSLFIYLNIRSWELKHPCDFPSTIEATLKNGDKYHINFKGIML